MAIQAKIIKDSINGANNCRLTTFVLVFPRFINAEILRHRMLSFNSASSRAIPSKKIIQDILDNTAMPEFWGANEKGMQSYSELDDVVKSIYSHTENSSGGLSDETPIYITPKTAAKKEWIKARDRAIKSARLLSEEINLHKQIANRILEPWHNITLIVSGTEWENFFALRAHKDAQPEFRVLAELMLEAYNKSIPEIKNPVAERFNILDIPSLKINANNWHIPFEDKMPEGINKEEKLKIAVARCARISYLTQEGVIDKEKDFDLFNRLNSSGHFSPTEHIAFPLEEPKMVGNFKGWFQYRKILPNETKIDSRIIRRTVIGGVVR
jgi:thymidylate synthase ThyX